MRLVTVLRTNCNNCLALFQNYLSGAIFSLCFFIQITFVCNFDIHNFWGKNGDDKQRTHLWFMKTQFDVISLCLITKLVERTCAGSGLLCNCWYQWMFVLVLLHAGPLCLCRWVEDVCTGECQGIGGVLAVSEFGLLEVRCWQVF